MLYFVASLPLWWIKLIICIGAPTSNSGDASPSLRVFRVSCRDSVLTAVEDLPLGLFVVALWNWSMERKVVCHDYGDYVLRSNTTVARPAMGTYAFHDCFTYCVCVHLSVCLPVSTPLLTLLSCPSGIHSCSNSMSFQAAIYNHSLSFADCWALNSSVYRSVGEH